MNFWTFLDRNAIEVGALLLGLGYFGAMAAMHSSRANDCPQSTAPTTSETQ